MKMESSGLTSSGARIKLITKLSKLPGIQPEVLDAMEFVPRHQFVDPGFADRAYDDGVLPIGFDQTISQPTVVAMMSSAILGAKSRNTVLEIGTGCGYQTAILALLFDHVYSVERISVLQKMAKANLERLNIRNVSFRLADGHLGWAEESPFDAVLCAAAFKEMPLELQEQVTEGARLVFPVERPLEPYQDLVQLDRTGSNWKRVSLGSVRFVPMLSGTRS